eukprot:6964467-Prorocentrum_lima.AAC.1
MTLDTCRYLHVCDYPSQHPDFVHVSECRSASLNNLGEVIRALIIPRDTKKATSEEVDLILEFASAED